MNKSIVIIPTYNERDNVEKMIRAITALNLGLDILIVDDNSPDGTSEIIRALRKDLAHVHLITRNGKLGLGTAYVEGFKFAIQHRYDYVFQMDCDFSHDPQYLPLFFEAIKDADLVLGSRYVPGGGTRNWPLTRQVLSRGGSLYARTILGLGIHDLTGGFKCFRRQVLETIDLDQVRSEGYSFQIEMTWRTLEQGFRVTEVPITFVERESGISKMNRGIFWEAVWMCWKLRLGLMR